MLTMFAIWFLAIAAATAGVVEIIRIWANRFRVLDKPNLRSSHTRPTPRVGGIAIVLLMTAGIAVASKVAGVRPAAATVLALVVPSLAIAIVSLVDDLRGTSVRIRLLVQAVAAVGTVALLGLLSTDQLPIAGRVMVALVSAFWIVGLINAYNFMDGLDGIAGLQALIAGIGWVILGARCQIPFVAWTGMLVAGTSAGFLLHNWSPARIFMGDVGSAFLGYIFAVMTIIAAMNNPRLALAGVLLVWPFVYDTIFTLVRRTARGERLSHAHRSHLYQRLNQAGLSHAKVSALYGLLACLGIATAYAQLGSPPIAVGAIVTVIVAAAILTLSVTRVEARRPWRGDLTQRQG